MSDQNNQASSNEPETPVNNGPILGGDKAGQVVATHEQGDEFTAAVIALHTAMEKTRELYPEMLLNIHPQSIYQRDTLLALASATLLLLTEVRSLKQKISGL